MEKRNNQSNYELAKKLKEAVLKNISIGHIVNDYGFARTLKCLEEIYTLDEIFAYYSEFAVSEFMNKRIKITLNLFHKSLFHKDLSYCKYNDCGLYDHNILVYSVVENIYDYQKNQLVKSNKNEYDLNKDLWVLYYLSGPSIQRRNFDFSSIESSTLKHETKKYYSHLLPTKSNLRFDHGFSGLISSLNIIYKQFPKITSYRDISMHQINYLLNYCQDESAKTQYNKQMSITTIKKNSEKIRAVQKFIMESDSDLSSTSMSSLDQVKFHNISAMNKATDILPDEVISQLDLVIDELKDAHRLIYLILRDTGLRLKEILQLHANCLSASGTASYFKLEYTPYKTLRKNIAKNKGATNFVVINSELANLIETQIKTSKEFRIITNSDYIFLSRVSKSGSRISLIQGNAFANKVNQIIGTNNITDYDGNLWNYTSRQSRKTLAVHLAESGASSTEIATQLGHADIRTTEKYYAAVRQKKLAFLNSAFFRKEFALLIDPNNLEAYSEEERRILYVDFALNRREVEFGQCSKHLSEGPCGSRPNETNCATCSRLCTGLKYIDKWNELVKSQQRIIDELVKAYEQNKICNYSEFIEYARETNLLDKYKSVVNKILRQEEVM